MIDCISASMLRAEELWLITVAYALQTSPMPHQHDNSIQRQYHTGFGTVLQPAHRNSQRGNQHCTHRQITGQQHGCTARKAAQNACDG